MDSLSQKCFWMLLGAAIAAPLTWWFASNDPEQPATSVLANAGDATQHTAPLLLEQAQPESASDPASSTELIALQQQILQLQEELEQVQNHTSSKPEQSAQQQRPPSSGNISRQLAEIFQAEARDPVWADELELQLGDFLYTSDLSTYFTYASYGCKRHVCQLSFVPRSEDIDAMQWQRLNDSLFNSPWIKQFKVSSAQQTAQGMLVHFSTKSLRELATEY
ncbi:MULTISPECIES: hypothetical protein [unclassified Pseudoalteromonas]|uniref:hypothetical protein n=1 Tax=unclassified Pseudoalteromonas TaxID=194690 RepID=UPI0020979B3C|nr:hypothetical protein [Pseudoalteromonas sp. XMcav2-N]MCO7188859.1 hypothetical protein [Pseudoalteromonas sp. XMcav2-N]